MSDNTTYSFDLEDSISFNILRHALLQDRQINLFSLKSDFEIHQIFSDWLHRKTKLDEDNIRKNISVIVRNNSNERRVAGISANQIEVWNKDFKIETFTETSFRKSTKTLGFSEDDITKLDQECAAIVTKHFVKVQRPVIKATDVINNVKAILNEASLQWTASIDDAIKIGRIYDAVGMNLISDLLQERTITTPEILFQKINKILPRDVWQDYTYPQISGNGQELAKFAAIMNALSA